MLAICVAASGEGNNIDGHWKVRYTGGPQMTTMGGAEFDFKAQGNELTGTANIGMGWPGEAPISNGRIEGDHISFMVFGRLWSTSGFPKMRFTGTIHGDEIKLTMILFYEKEEPGMAETEFEGKRESRK
jgi:hypothetical protein